MSKKDGVLFLVLKEPWFSMIKAGIKKEEYRECSEYWIKRLDDEKNHCFKHFDKIVFTLGYPKKDDMSRRLEFKNPSIHYRTGKPEWGAEPNKKYFVITWDK